MEQSEKQERSEGVEAENISVLDLCKCGRAPKRKGQRNCHFCNRAANKKYQARLRRDAAALQDIAARIRSI